jgi:hypothetical protein
MTAGAVASLVIYRSLLKIAWDKDPRIQKGLGWLAANWKIDENVKARNPGLFAFYWMYAVERVGGLMSLAKIGESDWWPEGAEHLIKIQQKDGSWDSKNEMAIPDTCFAVLFLRKATRPAPKIASGVK